jgi:hypothetical protein
MRLMPRLLVVYALAAALFGIVVIAMRDAPATGRSAPAIPSRNAAWIDHHWVGASVSRSSIASLCATLTAHEIGAVFVHVGPADASGNIAAGRAPYAQRFVTTFHAVCPNVQPMAWIGQLLPTWDGLVNLQSDAVRAGLVRAAQHFVALGFDGIQYDLEPVADGDPAFLALLRLTRAALPGRRIAVATPSIALQSAAPSLPNLRLPLRPWSATYFMQVAALSDELDPMLYVTGLRDSGAYASFIADQVRTLATAAPSAAIRIGLPAFSGRTGYFDDRVENIRAGLLGLTRPVGNGKLDAVAIYPMWDMTPSAWAAFDNWLARSRGT